MPELPELSEPDRPIFKSWFRLYAVVLGELAILIVLFYLFTRAFE
jgi:hypothetical protein